ncbi:uncharacterized protein LOC132304052 [Cornus florida]|uniref:uncharacterized protein LOC132304052 n=1 Tax=Cornus florida TaxID=4283 RepID=UPI00289CE71A|nr:uncharacterized protein LOC132304052 [Cornus florida]
MLHLSMASARPLTMVSKLFSTSFRRLHQQHRLYSTRHCPSMDAYTKNPFGVADEYIGGPRWPRKVYLIKICGESLVVLKVDLPGMVSEGLKLWVDEERNIAFEGKIKSEPKYDYEGGSYHGVIPVIPLLCHVEKFKFELTHGVLWVSLPLTEEAKAVRKVQLDLMKKGLVKY